MNMTLTCGKTTYEGTDMIKRHDRAFASRLAAVARVLFGVVGDHGRG